MTVKKPHPGDEIPTPVSGYVLPKGGFSALIELGYPNLNFEFLFGAGSRVQLGFGYRGVYTMNHTPYGSLKIQLNSRNRDVLGLALKLAAGYSFGGHWEDGMTIGNLMAGEYKFFGELWFQGTARRGRHGLLFGIGARVSQAPHQEVYYDYYDDGDEAKKVMGTLSLEIGYEVRINRVSAFFIALGVDIFMSEDWIPALPRFRMGFTVGG
jgi:hypothetical protein